MRFSNSSSTLMVEPEKPALRGGINNSLTYRIKAPADCECLILIDADLILDGCKSKVCLYKSKILQKK